jgi:hypothetical protein
MQDFTTMAPLFRVTRNRQFVRLDAEQTAQYELDTLRAIARYGAEPVRRVILQRQHALTGSLLDAALRSLLDKGHIERTRRGQYLATASGKAEVHRHRAEQNRPSARQRARLRIEGEQ